MKFRSILTHLPFVALLAESVALDQWTKRLIVGMRESGELYGSVPILGGLLHLTYAENTGGAFGMFGGETVSVALLLISVAAFVFIGWYYWVYRQSRWMRTALTLIAGGAVGNFIDRVRLQYVVDFIDVDIASYQWPFFNLADSFICTGAGMLLIHLIRERAAERAQQRATEQVDDVV